eukprot:Nitzschia sp. Nitz4//scaffold12_size214221//167862//169473//NITZ4_001524-RA/size214221-processed-gene-0.367-mRNA-1//-1//CDS//3329535092//9311//frame0
MKARYVLVSSVFPSLTMAFMPLSPLAGATSAATTTLYASKVTAPERVGDLSSSTADLYEQNVQTTYGRYPLTIAHGKGSWLTATDGQKYLDFVSGIATCALGHNNPALSQAVYKQMQTVHHTSNLYFLPGQAALANWLCENSVADKAFFCNSGAEANEAAIKLARRHAHNRGIQLEQKPVIITAHQSFHGRTLATVTATAQPKYHKGFGYGGQMVPGFDYCTYNDVKSLEEAVERANSNGQGLAAILLEPIQGEGGIINGDKMFFAKARELCDEQGALLMIDEVQAGMGRTGTLWGHEQLDVVPDVFTSAKALGGGVPIGAMLARGAAATTFGPGDHSSTYGGNPLACAAGLAVAQYMHDHGILENVKTRGKQLENGLNALTSKFPRVLGKVRGQGLLRGVEIVDNNILAGDLVNEAMKNNLLVVPAGTSVVRFLPPLTVTENEVELALEKFEKVLMSLASIRKGRSDAVFPNLQQTNPAKVELSSQMGAK